MNKSKIALENRAMSGFPVSIGTGLALETIFNPIMEVYDENREVNRIADISRYDRYIINVATLIRNIFSAIDTELIDQIKYEDLIITLKEEINFIYEFFKQNNVKIDFYCCSHDTFKTVYKNGIRKPTTKRQIEQARMVEKIIKDFKTTYKQIHQFDSYIKFNSYEVVLMLSHYPSDLISHTNFKALDLLESNTGVIKKKRLYNTKYFPLPREDMSMLPFFEFILVTFGDKVLFKPKPIKERLGLYKLLNEKKVNPLTSEYELDLLLPSLIKKL